MTLGAKGSPRWQTSDDRDLHPTAAARDCCLPATWTRLQTDSSSSLKMSPPAWMTPTFHPCEIRNADLKDPQARALTNSIALSWCICISLWQRKRIPAHLANTLGLCPVTAGDLGPRCVWGPAAVVSITWELVINAEPGATLTCYLSPFRDPTHMENSLLTECVISRLERGLQKYVAEIHLSSAPQRVICIILADLHVSEGLSVDVIVMVCFTDGRSPANAIWKEHSLEPTRLEPESGHFQFLVSENVHAGRAGRQPLRWTGPKIRSRRGLDVRNAALIPRLSWRRPLPLPEVSLLCLPRQLPECVIIQLLKS